MQTDKSQLSLYASRGDAMNYSIYVHEEFTKHLKQNAEAVKAGLESLKNNTGGGGPGDGGPDGGNGGGGGGNGTGGEPKDPMAEIKASMKALQLKYKSLKDTELNCFESEKHANLVLDYYDAALDNYEMRAQNLSDRGIDAGNIQDLVNDARAKIITPMRKGIDSADNSSQYRIILDQYCLYDGCANGANYHMAAKFEAMRMSVLLKAMETQANAAGLSNDVNAVQAKIDSAKIKINSWGNKDPSPDDMKAVWGDLRSASKGNHDLFIALNGSASED